MPLEDYTIDEITKHKLQELVEAGVAEGRDIDFKEQTYGTTDADKREFLADVSSFANTVGGHILIGIKEEEGVACELIGIGGDSDRERTRLEEIARSGLQPRLVGFRIFFVSVENGRNVLVIRIPRSWNAPHRVIAHRSNRFWARDGGGKYQPDVDQLRELFLTAPSMAERLRNFRADRIARIWAEDGFVPLIDQSALVLHILPFESFSGGQRFEVAELRAHYRSFLPIASEVGTARVNLDGLIVIPEAARDGPKSAYTQVWRTGLVEAVRSPIVRVRDEERVVFSNKVEPYLLNVVPPYLAGLRALGVNPPLTIFVSLIGVQEASLDPRDIRVIEEVGRFDRNFVHTSEILLTDWPRDDRDIPTLLRQAFDEIAYAAGCYGSPNFDAEGNWNPGRQTGN